MNTENENIKSATAEETANAEANNETQIEKNEREFISEFAPEPIQIPKYNKEKEQKKHEKATEKMKKRNTKKSKKRRKLLRKIIFVIRTVILFVVLSSLLFATLSSLVVKMNTSQYSIESAIRTSEPERFTIGKIKNPGKINMKKSSPRASVADVIRDNSLITVTYADIEQAVRKSSYPDFVADIAHKVVSFYIYGNDFKDITEKDISQMLLKNVSYIKLVTGVEIGESACNDIAKYALKSKAFKELNQNSLQNQAAAKYTYITSVLFSTMVLICLVIAVMLFLVLTVVSCNGFAHKMIGWACIISGVAVGAAGFIFKPAFKVSSEFLQCITDAIVKSFNQSSLIYGSIVLLAGVLVMLIGRAMADDEYEEDTEEEYIEELEEALIEE